MATIQNQAIIQKLVDELELYPALDKIPTELAEKILPVFQVNSEIIEVSPKTANVVRRQEKNAAGVATIYTVPTTGKFYLTNVSISNCPRAGEASNQTECNAAIGITIDGSAQIILETSINHAASQYGEAGGHLSFNLQNPVLIDAGTNITLTNADAGSFSVACIVGYTLD